MEHTRQGWVRFYRKSIDSSVWKNPIVWMVWSWCLLKASHSEQIFPFNGGDMIISKGSFITGRSVATKELPISEQQWRTATCYLVKTGRVTLKSTNKFTIISIVKWDYYQNDGKKVTNEQPTSNQPVTTYKNVNNAKEILTASQDKLSNNKKDMKKYNETVSSDSYETVIDADSGEITEDVPKNDVARLSKELVKWAQTRRKNFKFPNIPKQLKAIRLMREAGITPVEIMQRWEEMENDKFWSNGFDFMSICGSFDKKR